MYKVFSQYTFLSIALFISVTIIPANAENGNNFSSNKQNCQETTKAEEKGTGFSVKKVLGKGLLFCAIGYYAYYYGKRYFISYVTNKKLSNPFTHSFFSNYRLSNSFNDKNYWVTAKDIFDNKLAVKKVFYSDLLIPGRIIVNNKEYALEKENDDEKTREIYKNIIRAIDVELRDIKNSIANLKEHTNIFDTIKNALTIKKQFPNLDDIYLALCEYDQNALENVEQNLKQAYVPERYWQKFIKFFVYPRHDDLTMQCWEYIKNYVRIKALKNVLDEEYQELLLKSQNNEIE